MLAMVLRLQPYKSSLQYIDAGGCSLAFVCGIKLLHKLKTAFIPLLSGNAFISYGQVSQGECHECAQSAHFSSHRNAGRFSDNLCHTSPSAGSCGEGIYSWQPQPEAAC